MIQCCDITLIAKHVFGACSEDSPAESARPFPQLFHGIAGMQAFLICEFKISGG